MCFFHHLEQTFFILEQLQLHIEAIIFTAEQAVSVPEIINCLDKMSEDTFAEDTILDAIEEIIQKYQKDEFAFELVTISEGYLFLTKQAFHGSIAAYQNIKSKKRLSNAAMETLAIIAYKQPITKAEMEQIRGVNCDYSVHKLLEKELITTKGRAESPGRPMLYGTSDFFMNYFGITSMDDLPKLKDVAPEVNTIGEADQEKEVNIAKDGTELAAAAQNAIINGQAINTDDLKAAVNKEEEAETEEKPEMEVDEEATTTDTVTEAASEAKTNAKEDKAIVNTDDGADADADADEKVNDEIETDLTAEVTEAEISTDTTTAEATKLSTAATDNEADDLPVNDGDNGGDDDDNKTDSTEEVTEAEIKTEVKTETEASPVNEGNNSNDDDGGDNEDNDDEEE